MKFVRVSASLVVLAGAAISNAQPALTGSLAGKAQYTQRWLQNQPTSFGDNRADLCVSIGAGVQVTLNNSNVAGVDGNSGATSGESGAGVTTGVEVAIPLSQIGNPTGAVRIFGYIAGGDGTYMSNQVFGGLPAGYGNLAEPSGWPTANQWSSFPVTDLSVPNTAATNIGAITIDGTADAAYGSPIYVNTTNGTGFGDATQGSVTEAHGSEIDGVYAKIATASVDGGAAIPYLLICVTGNLEVNYNRMIIWIDTGAAGGQNTILAANPGADSLSNATNMTFANGFAANYYVCLRAGPENNPPVTLYADFAQLSNGGVGGGGGYLGGQTPPTPVVGTGSSCPPDQAISVGSELDGIYSYLDRGARKLYIFASGDLAQNQYFHFFFDANGNPAGNKGQNVLGRSGTDNTTLVPNTVIGIPNHLVTMGADSTDAGLTFPTGFYADFWCASHFEDTNRMALDSAVIRNGGLLFDPTNTYPLDYGAYSAQVQSATPPIIEYDGSSVSGGPTAAAPGIVLQDTTQANLYSAFGPRASATALNAFLATLPGGVTDPNNTLANWETFLGYTAPVPPATVGTITRIPSGLLQGSYSNLNVAGVTDTSGANAASAQYGVELAVATSEIGWNALRSNIKLVAFLADDGAALGGPITISNQVTGGSGQTASLGNAKSVNFQTIPGNHVITVAYCLADFNQSGAVTVQDIFDFLSAWFAHNPAADVNGSGSVTVQDIFDFLGAWFGGNCS